MHKKNVISAAVSSLKPGGGKTYSIILQALLNKESNFPSVIAVPSILLQEEYKTRLLKAGMLECELEVINSETVQQYETVSRRFFRTLASNKTIIITHEALKLIDHRSSNHALYAKRDLLIDEAFDPISSVELSVSNNPEGDSDARHIDWTRWLNPTGVTVNGFIELSPKSGAVHSDIYNITTIRTIENKNYKIYVSELNWSSLIANDAQRINIFGLYDITVLARFKSISISSAAFHTTTLGIYLQKSGIKLNITHEYEKHDEKIIFHVAKTNGELYSHSKSAIKEYYERIETFREYVAEELNGRKSLLLRNVSDTTNLPYSDYQQISNNCHGMNEYRNIDAISIESAYNANSNHIAFMQSVLTFTKDQIAIGLGVNTFYQCILRTSIRDKNSTNPVDVFLLDSKAFPHLIENYFSNYEVKTIDIGNFNIVSRKQRVVSRPYNIVKQREETISTDHVKIVEFVGSLTSGMYKSSDLYTKFVNDTGSITNIRKFALSLKTIGVEKVRRNSSNMYRI